VCAKPSSIDPIEGSRLVYVRHDQHFRLIKTRHPVRLVGFLLLFLFCCFVVLYRLGTFDVQKFHDVDFFRMGFWTDLGNSNVFGKVAILRGIRKEGGERQASYMTVTARYRLQ
jgi:hypothetical protein